MSEALGRRDLLLTAVAVLLTAGLTWAAATINPFLALAAAIGLVVFVTLGTDRAGVVCLVVAFATAPMSRGLDGLTGGIGTPTDLFLVLAWLLLLPSLANRRLGLPTAWTLGIVVLFSFALLGSAISSTTVQSLASLAQWMFFLAGLPLLIAWWNPASSRIVALLWAYVGGHMVSTFVGLAEGKDPVTGRYDGLTIHPNGFGLAGLVSLAILFYLYQHHRGQGLRLLMAGAALLSLTSIWFSGSRGALAVAIALVAMLPLVERSTLSSIGVFSLGAVVLASGPVIVSLSGEGSALGRLLGGGSATVADDERESAFSGGIERFLDAPLTGSGLVNVELIHNLYVEVAVAAGVVGLIGYLLVLGTLARPLFGDHPQRRLAWMAWAVVGIAAALPGLWDRTIWVPVSLAILPTLLPSADPRRETAQESSPESDEGSTVVGTNRSRPRPAS
ncbi:hypothetical protein [Nocardioides sp.]|uniref:O-antigen ligase family protein n=1 Tax=Nocardioides sp. TaxID=35761 RepID=UPI002C537506|nr:hypothetical protein [Nocardioides sp.]HSX66827.1 hypothetical protein [Nocardioides sp.]